MTRIDEQKRKNIEERKNIDDIPTQLEMTQSEHISTPNGKKDVPKVNSEPDPSPSDSSDSSSSSDLARKRKKSKKKKNRRKHRKYDSSEPSSSDDSDDFDSSEDSHYRRRQRKKIKEIKVKRIKTVVSIEKMTCQTRPRVMTLMNLIHLRTVIIDVDDARIRNIGKRTQSDYAQL